jgi:hypothetical protein
MDWNYEFNGIIINSDRLNCKKTLYPYGDMFHCGIQAVLFGYITHSRVVLKLSMNGNIGIDKRN